MDRKVISLQVGRVMIKWSHSVPFRFDEVQTMVRGLDVRSRQYR